MTDEQRAIESLSLRIDRWFIHWLDWIVRLFWELSGLKVLWRIIDFQGYIDTLSTLKAHELEFKEWLFINRWSLVVWTPLAIVLLVFAYVFFLFHNYYIGLKFPNSRFPWTLFIPWVGWHIGLFVWFIRDFAKEKERNQKDLDQKQKARELQQNDFHKFQEWAATRDKKNVALRVGAIQSLSTFIKREEFRESTKEILFSIILHIKWRAKINRSDRTVRRAAIRVLRTHDEFIGGDLAGANLTDADLSRADLRKADLSRADLRRVDLRKTNLSGANLEGANLLGVKIDFETQFDRKPLLIWEILNRPDEGRDLNGVDLIKANLAYATLDMANLIDANLKGATLKGGTLTKSDLADSNLFKTDLSGAVLSRANLTDATLSVADLTNAKLKEADLCEAELVKANLTCSHLQYANLSNVDLRKANLTGADLNFANLTDADLTDANLHKANLRDVDLSDADLKEANLDYSDLSWANLNGASLIMANLNMANLTGVNLIDSDLKDVLFWSNIRNLRLANIANVKNPPDGFREWALQMGAVEMDFGKWKEFKSNDYRKP